MTNYNFDQRINRHHSNSQKWERYKDQDIIPMWVADMDFISAEPILDAMYHRVDHGIFGYTNVPDTLISAFQTYMMERHQWSIDPEWLVWLPNLEVGINLCVYAFVPEKGSYCSILPAYPPFIKAKNITNRSLVGIEMQHDGTQWALDYEKMQQAITSDTKMLLLCSPHNPTGKVWSEEELRQLADFCQKNDLICCSDEIHCDLILDDKKKHYNYANINATTGDHSVTLLAPSKTWNLAGLSCSVAVIPNPVLRQKFLDAKMGLVPNVNIIGYCAAEAAYRDGEPWRRAVVQYLRSNRDLVVERLGKIDGIEVYPNEATYLAWMDVRGLGLDNPIAFFERAGVGLSDGADFGMKQHVRLNFGCSKNTLLHAIERIESAVAARY